MIDFKPKSGLGNRMQALDSAVILAQELQRELHVYWVRQDVFNCRFDRLWKPIVLPGVHVTEHASRPMRFWRTHPQIRRLPLDWMPGPLYFPANKNDILRSYDVAHVPKGRTIRIESYSRFRPVNNAYKFLAPVDELQSEIDNRVRQYAPRTIGVHIRRTDNIHAIRHSPDHLFIDTMRKEQEQSPDVRFYLASDDNDVKDRFRKEFGDAMITYDPELSRNTEEGIRAALVELYCLAATSRILGSHWSSYSQVAGELGGIPVERLFIQ